MLENRQWKDWDAGLPGKGLVIYHVNYNESNWSGNTVNTRDDAYRFSLFHASNTDYTAWDDYLIDSKATTQYANSGHMNNLHLSNSAYPLLTSEATNAELTDTSVPAATVFNANANGELFMSKAITNIVQNADGTVSFRFMGGQHDAINQVMGGNGSIAPKLYDLSGRRLTNIPAKGICIEQSGFGRVRKVTKQKH